MVVPYFIATSTAGNNLAMTTAAADLEAGTLQAILTNEGLQNEETGQPIVPAPAMIMQVVNELVANSVARAPAINPGEVEQDELALSDPDPKAKPDNS